MEDWTPGLLPVAVGGIWNINKEFDIFPGSEFISLMA